MVKYKRQKRGEAYFYVQEESLILKDGVKFVSFPGMEEGDLLNNKQYIQAITITALRIEQNLKWLYLYEFCPQTMGMYVEIFDLSFHKILNLARASKLITGEEFEKVNTLRKARNEVAHDFYIRDQYVDPDKVESIVRPCIDIINDTHKRISDTQKELKQSSSDGN